MDKEGIGKAKQYKPSVTVTGTAHDGQVGPPAGLVDVGISDTAYFFQIALPGMGKNPGNLQFHMDQHGKVTIEGVLIYGDILNYYSKTVFQKKVQQMCPPGPFGISFNLPGPVDSRLSSITYRPDGILEGVITKFERSTVAGKSRYQGKHRRPGPFPRS